MKPAEFLVRVFRPDPNTAAFRDSVCTMGRHGIQRSCMGMIGKVLLLHCTSDERPQILETATNSSWCDNLKYHIWFYHEGQTAARFSLKL